MAMNKAEKAALEALYERAALSWPPPPPKTLDLTGLSILKDAHLRGWTFNVSGRRVEPGVCLGSLHYNGKISDDQIARRYERESHRVFSQGAGGPWYATRADALRALHHAVAATFARDLANIQRQIEAEEALSQASGEAA